MHYVEAGEGPLVGATKAAIVGHDRGARVGTRFVKDYPEATDRFVAMDNIPTRLIYERMNAELARKHWFFISNPAERCGTFVRSGPRCRAWWSSFPCRNAGISLTRKSRRKSIRRC
jgi:pimeloyl-ACP methyl ester carboxylesterase